MIKPTESYSKEKKIQTEKSHGKLCEKGLSKEGMRKPNKGICRNTPKG